MSCKVLVQIVTFNFKSCSQSDLVPHNMLKCQPQKKIGLLVSMRSFEFSDVALSSMAECSKFDGNFQEVYFCFQIKKIILFIVVFKDI